MQCVQLRLVALTGILRNRTQGIWVLAHRLALGVFIVGLVHAQMIGSEARGGIWFFVHVLFASAVLAALIRRFALLRT
jgi:hypothetical protein